MHNPQLAVGWGDLVDVVAEDDESLDEDDEEEDDEEEDESLDPDAAAAAGFSVVDCLPRLSLR